MYHCVWVTRDIVVGGTVVLGFYHFRHFDIFQVSKLRRNSTQVHKAENGPRKQKRCSGGEHVPVRIKEN